MENVSNPNVSLNDFINTYLNRLSTVNNEFQIINITDGTLAGKPAKIIVSEEMDIPKPYLKGNANLDFK